MRDGLYLALGRATLATLLLLTGCAGTGGAPERAGLIPAMVRVPAGRFWMGSRDPVAEIVAKGGGEAATYERELPRHQVEITQPFLLGATEVTNAQFAAFVQATGYVTDAQRQGQGQVWKKGYVPQKGADWLHPQGPGSSIAGREAHPVVQVSWRDAQAYCQWLGQREGRVYRLPTEAQWEYACRAGSQTPFAFGETISAAQVNYFAKKPYPGGAPGVYRADTTPAGSLAANAWGLYDMHGNVWEWCQDFYDPGYYHHSPVSDPPGPEQGSERVVRGGSYNFSAVGVRSARRWGRPPDQGFSQVGFRVAAQP